MKALLVLAIIVGGAAGIGGAWIFHFILNTDPVFLGQHRTLATCVAVFGLLGLSNAAHTTKQHRPREYGVFVLTAGCGVFIHAIWYLPLNCNEACNTDFVLKFWVCLILMVDGFGHFRRNRPD
jgi:hypothetical protein